MKKIILIIVAVIIALVIGATVWFALKIRQGSYNDYNYTEEPIVEPVDEREYGGDYYEEDEEFYPEIIWEEPEWRGTTYYNASAGGNKQMKWDELSWQGPEAENSAVKTAANNYYTNELAGYESLLNLIYYMNRLTAPSMIMQKNCHPDDIKTKDKEELFLNNIGCFISKNNDLMLKAYARFKPLIFEVMNKQRYEALDLRHYMVLLDYTYSQYCDEKNKLDEDLLNTIYNGLVAEENRYTYFNAKMQKLLNANGVNIISHDDEDSQIADDIYWAYSFWPRRMAENNIGATRTILNDLWAHYEEGAVANIPQAAINGKELSKDESGNFMYKIYNDDILNFEYQYDENYKRTGRWVEYFNNGTVSRRCILKDGMLNGEYIDYNENHDLNFIYTFRNDSLISKQIRY